MRQHHFVPLDKIDRVYLDTAYFLFLTPGPGSKLYETYRARNKLITRNWRHYDGNSVVIWPKRALSVYAECSAACLSSFIRNQRR